MSNCGIECWRMPECATCGRTKAPRGRSVPLGMVVCDSDCPGYNEHPHPGHYWPGEPAWDDGSPERSGGAAEEREP